MTERGEPGPGSAIRVLMTPRNEENPYLLHLRHGLEQVSVVTDWWEMQRTGIQTLNTLMAPFELVAHRRRGAQILHLHWVYNFGWPWSRRIPFIRALPRLWFAALLWWAHAIGLQLVCTWHDLLPLNPIFDDDRAGRAPLIKRSKGIITITESAKTQLVEEFNIDARRVTVIPEGPPTIPGSVPKEDALEHFGVTARPLLVAFGHLDPYKGIDALLDAALALPDATSYSIRLMGAANDSEYAATLERLIAQLLEAGRDVSWLKGPFSDEDLRLLLAAAELVVIPFKRITNSGSVRLTMACRIPILLPELPSLSDIPRAGAFWYDPGDPTGLQDALDSLVQADPASLKRHVEPGYQWATSWSWLEVAKATRSVYESAIGAGRGASK